MTSGGDGSFMPKFNDDEENNKNIYQRFLNCDIWSIIAEEFDMRKRKNTRNALGFNIETEMKFEPGPREFNYVDKRVIGLVLARARGGTLPVAALEDLPPLEKVLLNYTVEKWYSSE